MCLSWHSDPGEAEAPDDDRDFVFTLGCVALTFKGTL